MEADMLSLLPLLPPVGLRPPPHTPPPLLLLLLLPGTCISSVWKALTLVGVLVAEVPKAEAGTAAVVVVVFRLKCWSNM